MRSKLATPELESLVAARRVLAPNYAQYVAAEEHAQAVGKLGEISLRKAVELFLRHNRADENNPHSILGFGSECVTAEPGIQLSRSQIRKRLAGKRFRQIIDRLAALTDVIAPRHSRTTS